MQTLFVHEHTSVTLLSYNRRQQVHRQDLLEFIGIFPLRYAIGATGIRFAAF